MALPADVVLRGSAWRAVLGGPWAETSGRAGDLSGGAGGCVRLCVRCAGAGRASPGRPGSVNAAPSGTLPEKITPQSRPRHPNVPFAMWTTRLSESTRDVAGD